MRNLSSPAAGINPSGIYAYVDVVAVWLKAPVFGSDLAWLKSQCGQGGIRVRKGPARFDWSYRQRLQISQPTQQALEWLAKRGDVLLNYVEISLDWIFDQEADRIAAYEFVCRHFVKKHHREQGIRFYAGKQGVTRYTARRWAPNVVAIYDDRPSKVTDEIDCVHFDWRSFGIGALRRLGIESVGDLIDFNHREFWRPRLLFFELIPDDLGRMYHNNEKQTDRRLPWIVRKKIGDRYFNYHCDRRTGQTIMRVLGSVQAVIDVFGRRLNVHRCMSQIMVNRLLPENQTRENDSIGSKVLAE